MSKKRKCYRCRLVPPPRPNGRPHAFKRGDGRLFCAPCLVLLMADAAIADANRASDALMTRHKHHAPTPSLDCPICAYEVR